MSQTQVTVEQIDAFRWRVPRTGGMRTDGLIFADAELMHDLEGDQCIQQVINVAHLPGIVGPSIAMPDIHWGYGFPIGGVAAFDEHEGVVSPGGVGYDINCGVRLLRTPLTLDQVRPRLRQLADTLYRQIPSGVGASRSDLKLSPKELDQVLERGAEWAVHEGYGTPPGPGGRGGGAGGPGGGAPPRGRGGRGAGAPRPGGPGPGRPPGRPAGPRGVPYPS